MCRPSGALLVIAALATGSVCSCSRSERPGAGQGGLRSPAEVTGERPARRKQQPPPPAPPPVLPASSPAEPASAPMSMPDIFALPPAPGSLVTDAQGRRFPFDQALVTVAAGTPREEVERIAASERGRVVGQIVSVNLYQLLLPTKSTDELEVAMDRLRKQPKVTDVSPNLMRNPGGPKPR
jgi:hypothetical protein